MSKEFLSNVLRRINNQPRNASYGTVTIYLNPYSYLVLRKAMPGLTSIDKVHCDGMLLAMLLRLTGARIQRRSFDMTSMARDVFNKAEYDGERLYLVGGESGVASQAASLFCCSYPNLKIVGTKSGFFGNANDRQRVISHIVDLKPDICIVGMGVPQQESFLVDLKNAGWKGEGYTCGGFFHQTAKGNIEYYPRWMDKLNLRWLYRMIDEPKLVRRYFIDYPKFLVTFLYDVACYYIEELKK